LETPIRFSRLALLGVGYIGGSAALAARRAGLVDHVTGYDPKTSAGTTALASGVIDSIAFAPDEAVRDADLVLLAAPVCAIPALLYAAAPTIPSTATVIDVGSVKAGVVEAAEAARLADRFVGCHPMAGAEFSGVEAARPDLFPGRLCFVCPRPSTQPKALEATRAFWSGIGCTVAAVDADVHDRLMAAQSHLPHVASFALAAALSSVLPFLEASTPAAPPNTSLRDTTRIAASGPGVWRDIFLANADHLLPLIDELETCVKGIRAAIASGDGQALERILAAGQATRRRLVKA
jgi:prephenate dehydrogenase